MTAQGGGVRHASYPVAPAPAERLKWDAVLVALTIRLVYSGLGRPIPAGDRDRTRYHAPRHGRDPALVRSGPRSPAPPKPGASAGSPTCGGWPGSRSLNWRSTAWSSSLGQRFGRRDQTT